MIRLGIIGDYNPQQESHRATDLCLPLAASELRVDLEPVWVPTRELSAITLSSFDALLVATGIYEERAPVFDALRVAREEYIPTLAMCGGFQHMIIEYARNVIGLKEVGHAEFDSDLAEHIIVPLRCSLRGMEGEISIARDSQTGRLYQGDRSTERFYCSFGLEPRYVQILKESPLRLVGQDDEGQIRITELPEHPFFIGTLFVPQARALAGCSHPLINGLLKVAYEIQQQKTQ
jgi:CTP synthase (UTP-ammonia lyase)